MRPIPDKYIEHDVVASLRDGRRHEFHPYLQPKVCLETRRTIGFEALMRWQPQPGVVLPPYLILPPLERAGLIMEMWLATVENVCEILSKRFHTGHEPLSISINVHPKLLADPFFVSKTSAITRQHGVSPSLIEIEIVEHEKLGDVDAAARTVSSLRREGFHVSLDDLGTGHASLFHLACLPVSGIKIDRGFLLADRGYCVIAGLAEICRRLGMFVLVEGIETEDQAAAALEAGAQFGQGFLFSRPEAEVTFHELRVA